MGLFGSAGLKSLGASVSQIVAALVGKDLVAKTIQLTGGTSTDVNAAGTVSATAVSLSSAGTAVQLTAPGVLNFGGGSTLFNQSSTQLALGGGQPLCPSTDLNSDFGKSSARWLNGFFGGPVTAGMGNSFTNEQLIGTANINTTAVGNVGASGPDDLITYTLPASALNSNGRGVRIKAWGTTANNANAKTVRLVFGSTTLVTKQLTVSIAGFWEIEAVVFRTGASTQTFFAKATNSGGTTVSSTDGATVLMQMAQSTAAETDTSAIVIKGQSTVSTADNDIVQQGMLVEFFN